MTHADRGLRWLTVTAFVWFATWLSPLAALEITASPDTSQTPLPRQYAPGTTVTLQPVQAVAPTGELLWLHDDQPISGATQATLTLNRVSAADTGNYRLKVTTGSEVQLSNTLTLNVLPPPGSAVDRTFASDVQVDRVVALADDGSMVVSTRSGYFRLREDGSRDPGFSLAAEASVLAGLPDGGLIVASAPYRTAADGSPRLLALPAGFDAAKPLTSAVVQYDGKLLIRQDTVVARLNADDSLDTTFSLSDPALAELPILAIDRSGRIYLSKRLFAPDPSSYPPSWTVPVRLMPDGNLDTSFATPQGPDPSDFRLIVPLADGRVFSFNHHLSVSVCEVLQDDGTAAPGWGKRVLYSQIVRPVVDAIRNHVYVVGGRGEILRYVIGESGLELDASFYVGVPNGLLATSYSDLRIDSRGRLLVVGSFESWNGHATVHLARLLADQPIIRPATVDVELRANSLANGSTVKLQSTVFGTGPFTYEWLALDGQPLPADRYSAELNLSPFRQALFGRYQLKVIGPGGGVLSNVVDLSLPENAGPYLVNLSGRAHTGQGENTVTAGLVTKAGASLGTIEALVRGVGPTLSSLGVTEAMQNPAVDVFNRAGQLVANNDQWEVNPETAVVAKKVGAFPLEPGSDAALVHLFSNGSSTMMLKAQGAGEGVGLLEIYQTARPTDAGLLLNLSLRARTAPGDSLAVAGFVITDPLGFGRKARVLLRAVGPTLATQGISHPLENPVLDVFNVKGERIASNDDWAVANTSGDQATLAAAMAKVGAFALPATSKDAALLLDLPAGVYTMHGNGGTGVVLLDIYLVK